VDEDTDGRKREPRKRRKTEKALAAEDRSYVLTIECSASLQLIKLVERGVLRQGLANTLSQYLIITNGASKRDSILLTG